MPFVLLSGVPTLVNGPETGLWPGAGLTHPLSEAYHRCCCTPPRLLTNYMNFCKLFLSRLDSLRPQFYTPCSCDFRLFFPRLLLIFEILKAQHRHPLSWPPVLQRLVPWGHYSPFFFRRALPLLPRRFAPWTLFVSAGWLSTGGGCSASRRGGYLGWCRL